ncbi:hypothetical protein [Bacillus sp. FJAT-50079]|uniref:hypothetical protein n=1 Tax=Bacillus sp. FJAT-50079 TaxID=2833577 RepID=UPI001BC8EE1F|nr:hypothetical protein [Bacillus sp. FJAT-50079]MBS4210263.1 hypothetical protein [Bacillus sp. FJAT-50079]
MKYLIIALALYLMYYTFTYALSLWKSGNKFASAVIILMAACFPVLAMLLFFIR